MTGTVLQWNDFRCGSSTDLTALKCDFRYSPEGGHRLPERPVRKVPEADSTSDDFQFDYFA
jgi:hypothetical protein